MLTERYYAFLVACMFHRTIFALLKKILMAYMPYFQKDLYICAILQSRTYNDGYRACA
jgi:hypothetical protein